MTFDELGTFVESHQLLHQHRALWASGDIELAVETYACPGEKPPAAFATSGRCIILAGRSVLQMTSRDSTHVLPGGRIEPGESIEEATIREVREETGVTITNLTPLGLMVFRHVTPLPPGYPYPYPIFTNTVFASRLQAPVELTFTDDEELDGRFIAIDDASAQVQPHERYLLELAQRLPIGTEGH